MMTMHRLLFSFFSIVLVSDSISADITRIHNHSSAGFADRETAVKQLTRRDQYVQAMSRFDRQCRLQSDDDVSVDEYLEFVSKHVLEWNPGEVNAIKAVLTAVHEKCRPYTLPLPDQVLFVKTDGKEEGGAAYCRGNAVVLPARRVAVSQERLERLVLHELFHVLSSHNPELREQLYSTIGFEICEEIPLPPSLSERKLTNPDAPLINCVTSLTQDGEEITVTPILFASHEKYESRFGGPFFKFLEFKLMVVAEKEMKWKPLQVHGAPVLLEPDSTPGYFKNIGRNTQYIIHPDEILADNFVHLILKSEDLKTPEIVDQMRRILIRDTGK